MNNKTFAALVEIIGAENLELLASTCNLILERSVNRQNEQTVTLIFSKGLMRHINGSDNVDCVKPKKYIPE